MGVDFDLNKVNIEGVPGKEHEEDEPVGCQIQI